MKANQLDQVLKNLPEEFKGIEFNQEVSALEKGHYHVLELNKVHIASEERYDTSIRLKKYNVSAWLGTKDELRNLGYKNLMILHDPTVEVKKPSKKSASTQG